MCVICRSADRLDWWNLGMLRHCRNNVDTLLEPKQINLCLFQIHKHSSFTLYHAWSRWKPTMEKIGKSFGWKSCIFFFFAYRMCQNTYIYVAFSVFPRGPLLYYCQWRSKANCPLSLTNNRVEVIISNEWKSLFPMEFLSDLSFLHCKN